MSNQEEETVPKLKMAVIGGGRRCLSLLQMLDSQRLKGLRVEIVGVADPNSQAVGFQYARQKDILTTKHYRRLFLIPGLEIVINLTGSAKLDPELAECKPDELPVLYYSASRLFQEIVQEVLSSGKLLAAQADEISRYQSFAQAISEATMVGVMVMDTNYHIVWINESALNMYGLTRKEALGQYCFQVSHQSITPCESPDTPCPVKETLTTKLSAHGIHEHVDRNSNTRYCDVSSFPLFNQKGEVIEVVEVIRDITTDLNLKVESRTKIIKDNLVSLVQEDKLIALGKLVASVAHEINNPIASIINFAKFILESLKEGQPQPEQMDSFIRYLDLTVREAQRCGRIVTNLLSFARQQTLEPKKIDLNEMMESIIFLTQHKMNLLNITLDLNLPQGPFKVWGDYTQIQQCLTNLVFNAMEAMPEGGRLSISGGLHEEDREIWLEFSDTGLGIEPDHLGMIFEPFFTTKSEVQGVGLGLSMVYGIIREHHGRITVESEPGQGAVFRLVLPTEPPT